MAETANSTEANRAPNTSDGDGKNTGAPAAGETQTSKSQTEVASTQTDKTFTQADLDKYAEKRAESVRREEKRRYEQLRDADLPAVERADRADKRVQELEKEIRQRDARETVQDAARKAGAANPQAVYKLVRADLEWDDKSGELSNLRDLIDSARQDAPELFPKRPGSGNGAEGSAGSFTQNMNDLIRRSAGRQ
jgi:hypothetical protein